MTRVTADVIMCTYNSEKYIIDCISSILPQLSDSVRLIIVDDCSSDDTVGIITSAIEQYACHSLVTILLNRFNKGLTVNLAEQTLLSRADYIIRMDSDDICFVDRFSRQGQYVVANPDIDILGGQAIIIDSDGKVIGFKSKPIDRRKLQASLYLNPFIHSTVIFKRLSLLRAGGYNISIRHGQDYELWFRCAKHKLQMANLDAPLVYLRKSSRSKYTIRTYLLEFFIGLNGSFRCRLSLESYFFVTFRLIYCILCVYLVNAYQYFAVTLAPGFVYRKH